MSSRLERSQPIIAVVGAVLATRGTPISGMLLSLSASAARLTRCPGVFSMRASMLGRASPGAMRRRGVVVVVAWKGRARASGRSWRRAAEHFWV